MPGDPLHLTLAVALSLLVGVLMGVIGGGGSFVYLLLLLTVGVPPRLAVGTGVVLGTLGAVAATGRHIRAGAVRWRSAAGLAAIGVPAALAGAALTGYLPDTALRWLVVAAMVVLGLLPLVSRFRPGADSSGSGPAGAAAAGVRSVRGDGAGSVGARRWLRLPVGGLLGAGTGAFGIAGGAPLASYLASVERVPGVAAVGTAMAVVTVTGGTAAVVHIGLAQVSWAWVVSLGAGATVGAYLGAALVARIPSKPLMATLGTLSLLASIGLVVRR